MRIGEQRHFMGTGNTGGKQRVENKGTEQLIWATSQQNQQNDLCAQQRLRSVWASVQSDLPA